MLKEIPDGLENTYNLTIKKNYQKLIFNKTITYSTLKHKANKSKS